MAVIEYFYAAHSGYAFDWHAVLVANGPHPTNGLTPQRRAYFTGREIEQWAEARGLEVITGRMPTYNDND